MGLRIALVSLALLVVVTAPRAGATEDESARKQRLGESVTSRQGFAFPPDRAELDKALDGHDYKYLFARQSSLKTEKDFFWLMNWEQFRSLTGGGYVVNKMYTRELWVLAENLERVNRPDAAVLKEAAVVQALYTLAVSIVDAGQCDDPTAPNNRTNEILAQMRPIFLYGQRLPPEMRERTVTKVIERDSQVAPLRYEDDALCRGGMNEMGIALKKVDKLSDAVQVPGAPGKTVMLPMPEGHRPKFTAPSVWGLKRLEAQFRLGPILDKLMAGVQP